MMMTGGSPILGNPQFMEVLHGVAIKYGDDMGLSWGSLGLTTNYTWRFPEIGIPLNHPFKWAVP